MLRLLRRDDRGTAMVEMSLVVPLILLTTLGVLEFGNALSQWILAEKATEMGVRFAITAQMVAVGRSDCGVATTQPAGTPCRPDLVPGSNSWVHSCTSTSSAGSCNAAAFSAIVTQMQSVYSRITPANVVVEYSGTGLGFVGRGLPVPNVTVRLQNMTFTFVAIGALVRGLFGGTFADQVPMPDFRATLVGEDLQS